MPVLVLFSSPLPHTSSSSSSRLLVRRMIQWPWFAEIFHNLDGGCIGLDDWLPMQRAWSRQECSQALTFPGILDSSRRFSRSSLLLFILDLNYRRHLVGFRLVWAAENNSLIKLFWLVLIILTLPRFEMRFYHWIARENTDVEYCVRVDVLEVEPGCVGSVLTRKRRYVCGGFS